MRKLKHVDFTSTESTSSSSSSSSSSSTPTTTASPAVSSATELSPDESLPAQNPDDTTMWPVTQRTNETEEVTSFESLTEENSSRLNETSTLSPTSSTSSLEGVDYKLSKKNEKHQRVQLNFRLF